MAIGGCSVIDGCLAATKFSCAPHGIIDNGAYRLKNKVHLRQLGLTMSPGVLEM